MSEREEWFEAATVLDDECIEGGIVVGEGGGLILGEGGSRKEAEAENKKKRERADQSERRPPVAHFCPGSVERDHRKKNPIIKATKSNKVTS